VAVGLELGLPFERIADGLRDFPRRRSGDSSSRRAERHSSSSTTTAIIRPRIAAVLARPHGSSAIVVAFQPHRFTRTAALMDAFGPALAGADHIVLTDIYAAGEEPIPASTLDALAAAVRATCARRSTSCRARRRRAGDRRACAAGRRRDHARRRVDRHVPDRLSAARGAARMSAVCRARPIAASAARTSSRRAAARLARAASAGAVGTALARRARYGVYRASSVARTRTCCRSTHRRARQRAAVEGRGARGAERPARREACLDRSRRWRSGCWRRRGCATPRCGARCRRRSKSSSRSGSRSAIGRINGEMYLVDERGVIIDQYGPQYADLDLPIIDGLRRRRADAVADRRARAELAARVIARSRRKPASRAAVAGRRHRSAQRAVILSGDPAVIQLGEDQFLPRLAVVPRAGAALRERVADIDYVDLRFDDRIYVRRGREAGEAGDAKAERRASTGESEGVARKSGTWSGSTSARRR
jgi:hypothetical protein